VCSEFDGQGTRYVFTFSVAVVVSMQTKKLNEMNLEETQQKTKRNSYVDASESLSVQFCP